MSLQFIIGSSGAGKSHYVYERVIRESIAHPEQTYYVIVPEQFTMQTQKTLVEMHPGGGILNIDVLSFLRLAYRILQETGGGSEKILEDTGKSMVLRKLVQQHASELPYLGEQLKKPGCLDEAKSLISEFMLYDIQEEEMDTMLARAENQPLLCRKLRDVQVLYRYFREYLSGHYLTGEELLDSLLRALPQSKKLLESVVVLDGFTGFTPIQVKVIRELLTQCQRVLVTVTMDAAEQPFSPGKPHQLFYMSKQMVHTLAGLTGEQEKPVFLTTEAPSRFADAPALAFLEKHLFRYHRATYTDAQENVQIFAAANPETEMEEAARRIHALVRTTGMKYGEIAVITGDLETYGALARKVFEKMQIPYFIDEKHTVLMNPFVEYLRAAMEMAAEGFSYESVFRYLRCGMSGLSRDETDRLENYVIALGIRGRKRWKEKWVRVYRGMQPELLLQINESREKFTGETGEFAEAFAGGKKTVAQFCTALYQFIVKSNIQEKLKKQELLFKEAGNKAMEKEYAQIYGIVMDLLDKMVEILGDEVVTRQEFRQLLEAGFSGAKVALIPPSMDQVLVGDMERTRLKRIKALFFVGVNEGNIPKVADSGGILGEMDREFLAGEGIELAPGPKELLNMQRFYLYLNMTRPEELLCLSYCGANSRGEAVSPAYLIHTLTGLFPNLCIQNPGEQGEGLNRLELAQSGIRVFLEGLNKGAYASQDPLFSELYRWYLDNPAYSGQIRQLIEAHLSHCPVDVISQNVAKVLYGEISPYGATRLERFCACAFAHFLQYGLRLSERATYEFRPMDMGNVVHKALEEFAKELRREGLSWAELDEEQMQEIVDRCLNQVAADYGNTILKSSARNEYMIERTRRMLYRTVWALKEQLKNGAFSPESFEVAFEGGRIDRVDLLTEDNKIYVKVIDYKTGNTTFDLVALYHGLQLQLLVYMDAALKIEEKAHPGKEILPAGVFYYNVKDPMLHEKMDTDLATIQQELRGELKMNGLVRPEQSLAEKIDRTLLSVPVSYKKDGGIRKGSSVADAEQFQLLNRYVKNKIHEIQTSILDGKAGVTPYALGQKRACSYCPYLGVCGFDAKIPGYKFRLLRNFSDEEVWGAIKRKVDQTEKGDEPTWE